MKKIPKSRKPKTTDEYILSTISATRALIIAMRFVVPDRWHARLIKGWILIGLVGACCLSVLIGIIDPLIFSASYFECGPFVIPSTALFTGFFAFLVSRCLEIVFAFYRDAMDKVSKRPKKTNLTKKDRIQLLFLSYIELIINFGAIDFLLQRLGIGTYSENFESISQAIYFSGTTITTVGYGDLSPKDDLTRCLSVLEAMSGLLLFAVALAVYLGESDSPRKVRRFK